MSDSTSTEVAKAIPSKAEAAEFTANLRDAMEDLCNAAEITSNQLRLSIETEYWSAMGYESWQEWYDEEFEEQIEFLRNVRLSLDLRGEIVQSLATGGLSNRQIASTIGVNEKTVRNDLRRIDLSGADVSASTEVDGAGQSVEEVGHIDDDEHQLQNVATHQPIVINFDSKVEEANDDYEARVADRFAGINFDAMVISMPAPQIIETNASQDTSNYFVPRVAGPSWSPPQITELPPPPVRAYDDRSDDTPEFLEPPMKLQKVGEANKTPEDKHCKTCACNLLP